MKLGQQSQQLHAFIIHISSGSPEYLKKSRPLTEMSRTFLKNMLERFQTAFIKFKYEFLKDIPYPMENLQTSDLFNSIPRENRNIIVGSPKITQSYEFVIGSRTTRIHMLLPISFTIDEKKTRQQQLYFIHSARLIWLWFHVVSDYVKGDCGETTDIYIHLTQLYKKKPKQGPIDIVNVNTAYTRTCTKNSTIQIFREEEWFKVLIHETFHNLGLDFSNMSEVTSVYKKNIQDIFHIETEGLLFETYCEMWATIFNTMFVISLKEGFPRTQPNINNIIKKMENMLWMESKYAVFQSTKVLRHMNISYQDLIHPEIPESHTKLQKYQERTNVFCYYVLKSVLLYHLDDFLTWCWKHNHGSLNFVKTPKNLKSFYGMVYKLYRSNSYIREHMYMEEQIKLVKEGIEYDTLRMTIYG